MYNISKYLITLNNNVKTSLWEIILLTLFHFDLYNQFEEMKNLELVESENLITIDYSEIKDLLDT